MADDSGQERTEQATAKRREEARKKGRVARSNEVNSAVMLFVGFGVLLIFGSYMLRGFQKAITSMFSQAFSINLNVMNMQNLFLNGLIIYLQILLPVFVVMMAMGILVNIAQIGFLFTGEPLIPRPEKINPFEGVKRIVSKRGLETLVRDIIKIVVVAWIAYFAIKGTLGDIMRLADSSVGAIFSFTGHTVYKIAIKIIIGYVVIAIFDYAFQRWDYEQSLKMTKQEVKEELKQTEGDPLLRARVRALQREISQRRMMEEVPKADVVITNPTHYAVAITYEAGMSAPVVVAKGKNLIAEKIRSIADEAGVPIVENVPLAQALFKAVDIGEMIPAELFTAVAEVLAYVYRLKGKKVV